MGACLKMTNGSPNNKPAVVPVHFDYVLLTETISTNQLRMWPSEDSLECRVVAKINFVKRFLQLPTKHRRNFSLDFPDSNNLFREILNKRQIVPVSLFENKFVYIQQENSQPLLLTDWRGICKEMLTLSLVHRRQLDNAGSRLFATTEISYSEVSHLPPELLSSTFRMLDVRDRTQQRRVCQLWNAIFLAEEAQEVRIIFDPFSGSCGSDPQYKFTVTVLKTVKVSTRWLIIQKAHPDVQTFQYCFLDSPCLQSLGHALCQQPVGKKRKIVFYSFLWLADGFTCDCPVKYLADKCQQLAPVCSMVMWRQCRICCDNSLYDGLNSLYYKVASEDREVYGSSYGDLPLYNGALNPASSNIFGDLLDIIDSNLPVVGPDLTTLSEWIDVVAALPDGWGWNGIVNDVRNYWFRDPRLKESEQNWLDFRHRRCGWDITKMPRPALYALTRVMILRKRAGMREKNAIALAARFKKFIKMG